jgi:hypothetical protein
MRAVAPAIRDELIAEFVPVGIRMTKADGAAQGALRLFATSVSGEREPGPGLDPQNQCGWFAQAVSYCDFDAVFFEFCGCSPAYFVPAVPFSLNADPGADAEPPGVLVAPGSPHSTLG